MDHKELVDKITQEVMSRLEGIKKVQQESNSHSGPFISQSELAGFIDHTLLKPDATKAQFDKLCDEAVQYKFYSVCVNSSWVPYVTKKLRGSGIKICAVIGFPLGAMDSRSKAFEASNAIEAGANELDMVINVGSLKSKDYKLVEEDIRAIKRVCRKNTILKVIIETVLLTDDEKVIACEIAKKAEADFVKTSTGFSGGGATVADIMLMRRIVGPKIGVKASGGIKEYNQAIALIQAGASRIGCGSSVAVITGAKAQGNY
ncbi:MAG: deoxyribose-phosphate aldolase [Salinivirgaceae bacterium]